MPTFTMELYDVIATIFSDDPEEFEQSYDTFTFAGVTYGKLPKVDDYTKIGLGTYPIFNELYRPILNGKIIDEYFNQEICTETIDNWLLIMRKKMDQIMPYYNQLYDTLSLEYSALQTMDIHSVGENQLEGNETVHGDNSTDTKTESTARNVGSDFPQTVLSGDGDYATNASDVTSGVKVDATVTQDSNATNNTNSNSDTRVTGFQGIASDLIMRYRSSLINIDTMILDEIKDCFMLVLNNGDEYFSHEYRIGW